MDRFLRFVALAVCGATLVWLHGCSGGGDASSKPSGGSSLAEQLEQEQADREAAEAEAAAEQAKAAAEARAERLATQEPTEVTRDDFQRGSRAKQGGRVSSAIGGVLAAGEDVKLMNIRHNLQIHGEARGYPKSHEEFLEVLKEMGLELPELREPFEYWYDAETREIKKREKP